MFVVLTGARTKTPACRPSYESGASATLRGLPFGHPPFFAFLAMAASLAGLLDWPPSLPICEYHSRTAGGGSNFVFIVSALVCPCRLLHGTGLQFRPFNLCRSCPWRRAFQLEHKLSCRHWNHRNAVSGRKSELRQPLALQSDFGVCLAPEEVPGDFDL
jgi:hypothetical protein